MANKLMPDVVIRCYTRAGISQRVSAPLIVADSLGATMFVGLGDSRGIRPESFDEINAANPTVTDEWWRQPEYVGISKALTFVRFRSNGTLALGTTPSEAYQLGGADSLAGFALLPRLATLDFKIKGDTSLNTSATDQQWKATEGTWKTVLPARVPQATRVFNKGPEVNAKIQTVGTVAANRGVFFEVEFLGLSPTGPLPGARFRFGEYSLVARQGMKWVVEKRDNGVDRLLTSLPAPLGDLHHGRYHIGAFRLAGRLVIEINGSYYHVLETLRENDGSVTRLTSRWAAGRLYINLYNVRAMVGGGQYKWSASDGTPFTGIFTRQQVRRFPLPDTTGLTGKAIGWTGAGTTAPITPTEGAGLISYDCTLCANDDGIDTPFVSQVHIYKAGIWTAPSAPYIDVRPAAQSLKVSLAQPPMAPGAEVSVELDLTLLAALDAAFADYTNTYCPVEIHARWQYTDGTTDAAYTKLFNGYIYDRSDDNAKFLTNKRTLRCRDPILRLQKPAGGINHRWPPMDVFIREALVNGATRFYGYDAVREILRLALGDGEADRLVTAFPDSHYPLYGPASDSWGYVFLSAALGGSGQPPVNGGLLEPAPYKSYAIDWIGRFAKFDRAVFFYGWSAADDRTTTWPRPIYGRWPQITASRPTFTIPDCVYLSGDQNTVSTSSTNETRHESDVNVFDAYSNPPAVENPYLPAMRMAESRVEEYVPDDPNRSTQTWERIQFIESPLAYLGEPGAGGVEALARIEASLVAGVAMQFPTVRFYGEPELSWGDKVIPKMSSLYSAPLGIDGITFRALSVTHSFDFNATGMESFTTSAQLRPVLSDGL